MRARKRRARRRPLHRASRKKDSAVPRSPISTWRTPRGENRPREESFHGEWNRGDEVLPLHLELAFVAAGLRERHLVSLDRCGRLAHVHLDAAEILVLLI